jgi:hypothetical protein
MVTLISDIHTLLIGVLTGIYAVEVTKASDRTGTASVARIGKEEAELYGLVHLSEPSGDLLSGEVLKVPRVGRGVVLRHEEIAEARLDAEEVV